jgi:hypothetical protein
LDIHVPAHTAIDIILVVGAVEKGEQGIDESAIVAGSV